MSEGQSLRGARAFSVGTGGNAIFEIPGRGFVKVEENSLVTLEDSNLGFQVRVVKGSADIRAAVPGALSLEGRPGQRAPIVKAPGFAVPVTAAAPAPVVAPPVASAPPSREAAPTIAAPTSSPKLPTLERKVAKERPVKLKQIIKQVKRPVRRAASVKPTVQRPKAPAAPAAAPMVPQILPIQVE